MFFKRRLPWVSEEAFNFFLLSTVKARRLRVFIVGVHAFYIMIGQGVEYGGWKRVALQAHIFEYLVSGEILGGAKLLKEGLEVSKDGCHSRCALLLVCELGCELIAVAPMPSFLSAAILPMMMDGLLPPWNCKLQINPPFCKLLWSWGFITVIEK